MSAILSSPVVSSSQHSIGGIKSSVEERALILLGQGINSEAVAAACGVSASRISQLLSQEEFAEKVSLLRYENLQKHNFRDSAYDTLEDALLEKLAHSVRMNMIFRPMEIIKAIQTINGAKRRGHSAPETIVNQQTIVNLILPSQITQKFTTNVNNQVVSVGSDGEEQALLTMQAGTLLKHIESSSGNVKGKDLNARTSTNEKLKDKSNSTAITSTNS